MFGYTKLNIFRSYFNNKLLCICSQKFLRMCIMQNYRYISDAKISPTAESSCHYSALFLEFPLDCTAYFGPHSSKCIAAAWTSNGCVLNENSHRSRLRSAIFPRLFTKNLRSVYSDVVHRFMLVIWLLSKPKFLHEQVKVDSIYSD